MQREKKKKDFIKREEQQRQQAMRLFETSLPFYCDKQANRQIGRID
jgi:hypothetical protein